MSVGLDQVHNMLKIVHEDVHFAKTCILWHALVTTNGTRRYLHLPSLEERPPRVVRIDEKIQLDEKLGRCTLRTPCELPKRQLQKHRIPTKALCNQQSSACDPGTTRKTYPEREIPQQYDDSYKFLLLRENL